MSQVAGTSVLPRTCLLVGFPIKIDINCVHITKRAGLRMLRSRIRISVTDLI